MKAFLQKIIPEGIELTSNMLDQMQDHWDLLLEWNERVNLTAILDPEEAADLHYRDSLAAMEHGLQGPVVDMGSGGGFPGIPLAIAMPSTQFTLVEPRRKRVSFLRTAVSRLGLRNVKISMTRAEHGTSEPFQSLVTRATFSNPKELASLSPWIASGGTLYFYRAANYDQVPGSRRVHYELTSETRALDLLDASEIS